MKRIYHPWNVWEDYRHNFHGGLHAKKKEIAQNEYASLLKDLDLFEEALKMIVDEWEYSCEHNLTNKDMNRVAYMGQAAMALVFGVPADVTRGGYHLLNEDEKQAADAMAQKYIDIWEAKHKEQDHVDSEEV